MDTSELPHKKGQTRKQRKARIRRRERKVVGTVRADVEFRDGYCRLLYADAASLRTVRDLFGACDGPSEWAHFGEKKRFKTRGMDPEERHTTEDSLKLCRQHHHAYDRGAGPAKLAIVPLDADRRCEGRLRFERDGRIWEETA